jgi:hypothetical protein
VNQISRVLSDCQVRLTLRMPERRDTSLHLIRGDSRCFPSIMPGATRIVCTGITTKDMSHNQRVFVRLRAKAACAEVKLAVPSARVWFQSRVSTKVQVSKRVVLTFKG